MATANVAELYGRLIAKRPLVQNITNTVVQQFTANVLLAMGASPAMVDHEADAGHFASIADTLRVPRDVMATIFESWRDGYASTVAELAGMKPGDARAGFDDIASCIRDPDGYAVWQVPIVTGLKP